MNVRIKICGITRADDALAAVEAGADALGFMFYEKSPRVVGYSQVSEIVRELPPFVARVGVFVNGRRESIQHAIDECGIDTLQFHGDESPDFCARFEVKTIKAFRVKDESSLAPIKSYSTDAWLLDAFVPGRLGGTGATFNWKLAAAAKLLGRPVILAGGLTPENALDAVAQVEPFALDVSSGVESAPGKKDHRKLRDFIRAVRDCQNPH